MNQTPPWNDPASIWKTEAAFDAWIRGILRRGWSRFPLKSAKLKSERFRAPIGRNGKEVFAVKCEMCGETFKQSEIQVDHIVEAGSLRQEGGIDGFIQRLFPSQEGMQILCSTCHPIKTLANKNGITIEQAKTEKEVIRVCKLPAAKQTAWMKVHGIDTTLTTNAVKRKAAISEHLNK
jgi:hypothetical protein